MAQLYAHVDKAHSASATPSFLPLSTSSLLPPCAQYSLHLPGALVSSATEATYSPHFTPRTISIQPSNRRKPLEDHSLQDTDILQSLHPERRRSDHGRGSSTPAISSLRGLLRISWCLLLVQGGCSLYGLVKQTWYIGHRISRANATVEINIRLPKLRKSWPKEQFCLTCP